MASWLFYIAVFLKQFYIFPSGNLGIADLFFAAACVMTFYGAWKNRTKLFYREDIPWVIFLIFVAIINGIESILSGLPIGSSRCIRCIGFIPRV